MPGDACLTVTTAGVWVPHRSRQCPFVTSTLLCRCSSTYELTEPMEVNVISAAMPNLKDPRAVTMYGGDCSSAVSGVELWLFAFERSFLEYHKESFMILG